MGQGTAQDAGPPKDAGADDVQVRDAWATRRRRFGWATGLLVVVVVLVVVGLERDTRMLLGIPPVVWMPLFLAFAVGWFALAFKDTQCPRCRHFAARSWAPRHCSHCGVRLG